MKIIVILIIFLAFGAFFVVSNENLRLNKSEDLGKFFGMYYNWIAGLYDGFFNSVEHVIGFVVKSEWLPDSRDDYSSGEA